MNVRWLPCYLIIPVCILVASCGDDPAPAGDEATFSVRYENIGPTFDFTASGVVDTPVGAMDPAPLLPGESYEFSFAAAPGQRLSFATMFVRSNDYFFSPDEMGIALFDENRNPVNGDVTAQVMIWDAGTEEDELQPDGLGDGLNARPQQQDADRDVGPADPDPTVRLASGYDALPATSDVLAVQISSMLINRAHVFSVTLTNASDPGGAFPTP
ncbi:MAG: spondin domain-containing protein, partial [Myxococcales bacterium]|nr:spondin domain-containing protein [Myxococcales bacterium]